MNRIRSIFACLLATLFVAAAPAWCCCAPPRSASCHEPGELAEMAPRSGGCCSTPNAPTPRRTDSKKCCPTDAPKKCCEKEADKAFKCGEAGDCRGGVQQSRSTWSAKPSSSLTPIELATLALPVPPWVAPPIQPASDASLIDTAWIAAPGTSLLALGCMLTI